MNTMRRFRFFRKYFVSAVLCLGIAVFLYGVQPAIAAVGTSTTTDPEYKPNTFLVEYSSQSQLSVGSLGGFSTTAEERAVVTSGSSTFVEMELPTDVISNTTTDEIIQSLLEIPGVVSVQQSLVRHATVTPDDTLFDSQWHLGSADEGGITAAAGWDISQGSEDVVIAVIDTGVDTDHVDLADNMWVNSGEIADNGIDDDGNGYIDDVNGYDFVDEDGDPNPAPDGLNNDSYAGKDTGVTHGTHVAGILGAVGNNGTGVSGVSWNVSIMGIRVLDDEGAGSDGDIAAGIQYAADNGADIIHMSLGGYGSTNALQAGVNYALDRDKIIVAAAGNDGVNINQNPFYPACYSTVIGVSSTGQSNAASTFSNKGSDCVNVAAPGESIYSTLYSDDPTYNFTTDYGTMSGTSMAAPVVSGLVGLLLEHEPTLTTAQVTDILELTADDIGLSEGYGTGRVNAQAALSGVSLANNPTTPTIKSYKNSKKKKRYSQAKRSSDTRPYFEWSAASDDDGIEGYYVYFGKNKNANPKTAGAFQTQRTFQPTKKRAKKFGGNEESYYLRVLAVDTEGNLSNSAASFQYLLDTVVKKPKGVTLTRVKKGMKVEWKKVKGEHVKKYHVIRRAIKGSSISAKQNTKTFTRIAAVKSKKLSYIDRSVKAGTEYKYRVRAVDDFGNRNESKTKKKRFVPQESAVLAAGSGSSQVRVYDAQSDVYEYTWSAYPEGTVSGVEIGVGDVDGDTRSEIVTIPADGAPQVKVFEGNGTERASFMAYDNSVTGARIAVGDVHKIGADEIVTLPSAGLPEVKIFTEKGTLLRSFIASEVGAAGGYIAVGNWSGSSRNEIFLSSPVSGNVYVYDRFGTLIDVFAHGESADTRVRISTIDVKHSSKDDVLVVPRSGKVSVQRFGNRGGKAQQIQAAFYGFVQIYEGGGTVASGELSKKSAKKIIVGSNGDRQATVQIFSAGGTVLEKTIFPFGGYTGPVVVGSGWFK